MNDCIEYSLAELKVARDPAHPRHLNPPAVPAGQQVLDVGCGAGQILIATRPEAVSYGCDIDLASLRFGHSLTNNVKFVCCAAEHLPYQPAMFDMVIARGSLVYAHIPRSLREIRRVLKTGGQLWMTLHSFRKVMVLAREENVKTKILLSLAIVNGLIFHFAQQQIRFPKKGYASFQTNRSITKALEDAGFGNIVIERGNHFKVTATAV